MRLILIAKVGLLTSMKKLIILMLLISAPSLAWAEPLYSELKHVPSVEENLREMDKDRNGLVTTSEVRAFLELKHGKDYKKAILDKIQSFEGGASCGTSFAQSFY